MPANHNISKKLTKINESIGLTLCENGFMVEVSGNDKEDNYKPMKIIVNDQDELIDLIKTLAAMPRA